MDVMMENDLYLLKAGELVLKGDNKKAFERVLLHNLTVNLAKKLSPEIVGENGRGAWGMGGKKNFRVSAADGRIYVSAPQYNSLEVEYVLSRLAGISGWARVHKCEKQINAILQNCIEAVRDVLTEVVTKIDVSKRLNKRSPEMRKFKVESRRTDKSFPLDSYKINCAAGDAVREVFSGLSVDVHKPDFIIKIEVRESAYVWAYEKPGLRGLPVGTAGRGMLLLSGGIDSPVAGFLMALRGMSLHAVYFDAYPYTPKEAKEKVIRLAQILGSYTQGLKLWTVSFTNIERKIKEGAEEKWSTVLLRMAMFECASLLAKYNRCKALITGESLSQVASQTVENIRAAESKALFSVFRPLIGMDKEDITKKACAIGTYETSILPYPDCCTLFSPAHPILRAPLDEALALYDELGLSAAVREALKEREVFVV